MRLQHLLFPLLFACADIPSQNGPAILATHVADWRDEVIYQVLIDRFEDGDINNDEAIQPGFLDRYQGGDWQGLENRLDYLQDLGITTLWITPIVKNVDTDAGVDGYHGYWASDLHKTNDHFGDPSALRSLINDAHTRGMKVVLDIVCNHMGQLFFYDTNLNGQPDDYVEGSGTTSPLIQINEYDPDWNAAGIQIISSEGPSGRAPIIFVDDPSINRTPPPDLMGTPGAYHGFGHILEFQRSRAGRPR